MFISYLPVCFVFESRPIQNFQPKQRKENLQILILCKETYRNINILQSFQHGRPEEEYSPSKIYYPDDVFKPVSINVLHLD